MIDRFYFVVGVVSLLGMLYMHFWMPVVLDTLNRADQVIEERIPLE